MITVAALYIDPRGPYPKMAGVDCWDAERDARPYEGPHPVVAHPPCGPGGRLRHLYKGHEHDCAPRAVEQVRRWGGVLEHPARSRLWGGVSCLNKNGAIPGSIADLPFLMGSDAWDGYTICVDQVEWGHVARKRTFLYLVGVPREALEVPPFPGREPTHWISGGRKHDRKGSGGVVPPNMKVCSAQQRRRTPPLFAEYLVRLARSVVPRG